MVTLPLDAATPGGVYLCQVSEKISCGACCGLYNVSRVTAHGMAEMLKKRTILFQKTERTIAGFNQYESIIVDVENQTRPFPEFHHCPYVALISPDCQSIGCLLHPMAEGNHGVDYRGISFYGGMACKQYFCPTCKLLSERYKKIIRMVIDEWFLYGLIVTEHSMLAAVFEAIELKIGGPINLEHLNRSDPAKTILLNFFRSQSHHLTRQDIGSNYFFEDQRYPNPMIDYLSLNRPVSRYDAIFRCFRYRFETAEALVQADAQIDTMISELVRYLEQ